VKFIGVAVTSGATAFTVDMIKYADNSAFGSAAQATCTPTAGNTCSVTFAPVLEISQNDYETAKIRVASSNFSNPDTATEGLSVLIQSSGDVLWTDGLSTGIQLEAGVAPFTIADVTYN
jgi:hypothetical protein